MSNSITFFYYRGKILRNNIPVVNTQFKMDTFLYVKILNQFTCLFWFVYYNL